MLDGSGDGRPSLMGGQADADNPVHDEQGLCSNKSQFTLIS
jgi:hypothetical protein